MSKPKQNEATEAPAIERVGLAELVTRGRAAAAAEIERMQADGLATAIAHLDMGEIEEAATIIGTAAVLAELTDRKMTAAEDIADDDDGTAEAARIAFRVARDGIAKLSGIEHVEPTTYAAPEIANQIIVGALVASLAERFPSTLRVELNDEAAADMARRIMAAAGVTQTGRSSRAVEGIGSSNRRQPYHVAAVVAGEHWELNLKHRSLAGYIDPSGHLVATTRDGVALNGGNSLGAMHQTKNPCKAQQLPDGRWAFVGTVGLLASLLTCDTTGNRRASVAGWDKVVITTGPNTGKTLHDTVPFPE